MREELKVDDFVFHEGKQYYVAHLDIGCSVLEEEVRLEEWIPGRVEWDRPKVWVSGKTALLAKAAFIKWRGL